jgi:plasmid stabilization system protein ParE
LTYTLHAKAEIDLATAVDFYKAEAGRVVAERFISEFERVANLLVEHPGLGTPTSKGRKVFPLQIFPYSVVYRDIDGVIRILVVRHQHRRPGFGRQR